MMRFASYESEFCQGQAKSVGGYQAQQSEAYRIPLIHIVYFVAYEPFQIHLSQS